MNDANIPQIHLGEVQKNPANWRDVSDEPDPDDEELFVTPPDVVATLGFDPADWAE